MANELIPTAGERQRQRAIRTLERIVHDLIEHGIPEAFKVMLESEEFDAACVRAARAAQEQAEERKRELVWFGLLNGWVRTHGDVARDRFLRVTARYDLEHFRILERIGELVTGPASWLSVSTGSNTTLTDHVGLDRDDLEPYLQDFHADGLIRLYDQPNIREASNGPYVETHQIALWKSDADRLLEFVKDPRNVTSSVE